jgi:hypothetical protein
MVNYHFWLAAAIATEDDEGGKQRPICRSLLRTYELWQLSSCEFHNGYLHPFNNVLQPSPLS